MYQTLMPVLQSGSPAGTSTRGDHATQQDVEVWHAVKNSEIVDVERVLKLKEGANVP